MREAFRCGHWAFIALFALVAATRLTGASAAPIVLASHELHQVCDLCDRAVADRRAAFIGYVPSGIARYEDLQARAH